MYLLVFPSSPKMKMKIAKISKQLIKPSSPTPTHLTHFKLSFIDERIPICYVPLILYYKNTNTKQSETPHPRLKRSLSDALVHFFPLAGRMHGQASVQCNDEGILYVEAQSDAQISDILKSTGSEDLDKLVPFQSNGCVSTAKEQLAVQVTQFACGGISIGICLSHRIADISTLNAFIRCWSAVARGDHRSITPPVFNSATLFPPRNTPDFKPNVKSPSVHPPRAVKIVTKRFVFTARAIRELKLQVTENTPTRVEVVTAFLWDRFMSAKRKTRPGPKKSVAYHPVSLRGRIPELTENSFGNIFQMARAEDEGETGGWVELVEKVRDGFEKVDSEYTEKLLGETGFELAKENFMEISRDMGRGDVEIFRFTSYGRLGFYGADFGWGRPVWVSSAGYMGKDMVRLFDSVEWRGGIEAWVVMADQDMESLQRDVDIQRFTSSFLFLESA